MKKPRVIKRKKKIVVKFHFYKKIKCQGKKELKYLKEHEKKYNVLLKKSERVKTPYGYYTPDFKDSSYLYEIKSAHTFKVCIGEISYKNLKETTSDLQWRKIQWVSENVKPVKVIIYFSRRERKVNYKHLETEFLSITCKGGYVPKK